MRTSSESVEEHHTSEKAKLSFDCCWLCATAQFTRISPVHGDGAQVFKALDFVLVEARRYGIRVILSVLDNWKYSGGIDEFVDWSATSPRRTKERPPDQDGDTATHVSYHLLLQLLYA
jgi:hypothetical protein